jgi:8-oxo-dGTP pyrophosphatase MutT (NUDIX family)
MHSQAITMRTIRAALQLPLPGRAAQQTMAVRPRPGDRPDLPNPCPHEGAVLLLVYRRHGDLVVPVTRRTDKLEMHKGQISLPGGARESQDADLAQTALRETCEELGIPKRAIELLGPLTPLFIPVSSFCVYPYAGYARRAPALRPDANEVAEAIEVPLEHLLAPETRQVETHFRDNQRFEVPAYVVGLQRIWGATAMILAEFLALLRTVLAEAG